MPLTLYMTPMSPPVRAVLMTAEALGLKLDCRHLDLLSKQEHLTPAFVKMNPQHTVPVLDDNGTIVWDSHAIISYLARKYGKNDDLYPKDFAKRAVVDQRMYFENSVVFIALRTIVFKFYFKQIRSISEEDRNGVLEAYKFLETFLTDHKWAAGESLSIADFSLLSSITSLDILVKIDEKEFPNIARWIHQAEQENWYKVNVPGLNDYRELLTTFIS